MQNIISRYWTAEWLRQMSWNSLLSIDHEYQVACQDGKNITPLLCLILSKFNENFFGNWLDNKNRRYLEIVIIMKYIF